MQNTQQFTIKTDYLAFEKARATIKDWIAAWSEADNKFRPRRYRLLNIYEMALVDNHLSSVIENRKVKVQGEPFIVFNKAGEIDEELGKLLNKKWFTDFVSLALDAIPYGFTLIELNPKNNGDMGPTKQVDRRNILPERNEVLIKYYNETGIRYDIPPVNDFYIYVDAGYGLGLLNKAIFWTIYKRSSNGSHATFNEEFGIPMLIAKSNGDDEEKAELLETLKKLGKQKMGVIGLDEEIIAQYAAAISGASDNFEAMSERANSEMSKLFLGHIKGTDDDKGSQAYINKDQSEKSPSEERKEKDMQFIENLVNDELFPRLAKFGMPFEGCRFMYLHTYMTAQARKKKTIAPDMLRLLLEHFDIDPEWIDANFGVPVKKKPLAQAPPAKKADTPTLPVQNRLKDLYGAMPEVSNGIIEDLLEEFEKLLEQWAETIYNGGGVPLNEEVLNITFEALWTGLVKNLKVKGYDDAYIQALRENIFMFSGAKTYNEYEAIKSYLLDEAGEKRSFQDFKDLVLKVNGTYNKQYLNAEYELAIASAQMIHLWQDIKKEGNPMLQFFAVGDERTTPTCKNLNGINRPADDSFWDKYYPPNHWRCRSTVKVVYDEQPTAELKNLPKIDKEFQNNVGKTGTVFTEAHPYFDALPAEVSKELLKKAKEYGK